MAELTYEILGQRLQSARKKGGFTQEQVAGYLDVPREYVSYYETGKRPIDMMAITRLADLYGYALTYFLSPEPEDERPIVSAALRLNDKLSTESLATIAKAKKLAMNLSKINKLLEE